MAQAQALPELSRGARNQLTARTGELFVAAEINRRGAVAAMFLVGMPGYDIHMFNPKSGKPLTIQVKTKRKGDWQLSLTTFGYDSQLNQLQAQPTLADFYVFVDLHDGSSDSLTKPPRYFIASGHEVYDKIHILQSKYLEHRKKKPRDEIKSPHMKLTEGDVGPWENRWDLLGFA